MLSLTCLQLDLVCVGILFEFCLKEIGFYCVLKDQSLHCSSFFIILALCCQYMARLNSVLQYICILSCNHFGDELQEE